MIIRRPTLRLPLGRGPQTPDAPPTRPLEPDRRPHFGGEMPTSMVRDVVYERSRKVAEPPTIKATFRELERRPDAFAWLGMFRPSEDDLAELAKHFRLHPLAIEDTVSAHQRPKLERYGDTRFMVLRAAYYDDAAERIEFGELHVFSGPNFVITVRHGEQPRLTPVRERMEQTPHAFDEGVEAIVYAILDRVVDGYLPVVAGLANDIDEIETQVWEGDPKVSKRIYELNREVIDFERAVAPLADILTELGGGFVDGETSDALHEYLRDVADHVAVVSERIEEFRVLLRDILQVNTNLVSQRQADEAAQLAKSANDQADVSRKVTAWAAILFVPTLVSGIYGMNFHVMPELGWMWGYPFALGLMFVGAIVMFCIFKWRKWL